MLSSGETDGVFQLESSGMKNLVKNLKPSVFEDLGALVALFRPGPLNSGMVDDFVQRKHGRQKVEFAHLHWSYLKDTYGNNSLPRADNADSTRVIRIFSWSSGYFKTVLIG